MIFVLKEHNPLTFEPSRLDQASNQSINIRLLDSCQTATIDNDTKCDICKRNQASRFAESRYMDIYAVYNDMMIMVKANEGHTVVIKLMCLKLW